MEKEVIHLASGETIRAEVNGKTLDGQRGHVLISVPLETLRGSLQESAEIEVVKRPDGEWQEVKS